MEKQKDEGRLSGTPTHIVVIYGENDSTGAFTPVEYKECRGDFELLLTECMLIEAEVNFTTHTVH